MTNPVRALLWNLDKAQYLADLTERGVAVIPTMVIHGDESRTLAEVLELAGWDETVVKPAVSLNANSTWRVSRRSVKEETFQDALTEAPPVRKVPADGEFRVQSEYGGGKLLESAPSSLLVQAEEILAAASDACGSSFTYARVDGVRTPEGFLLMELEILDPSLYLDQAPESVERARDAVLKCLK